MQFGRERYRGHSGKRIGVERRDRRVVGGAEAPAAGVPRGSEHWRLRLPKVGSEGGEEGQVDGL